MKLTRLLMAGAVAAALSLASVAAIAGGVFPGYPNSSSPGTASTSGATSGGSTIPAGGCIPMDTGAASGLPQTLCVSPNQLVGYNNTVLPVLKQTTIPIGSVALASLGTDTTPVSGTIYFSQMNLPAMTVTNIACLNGSAAATDKYIFGLYNSSGTLVANTALAGVTASGTNAFQSIALTTPYTAVSGQYFVGVQTNGTTTRLRTIATATYLQMATTSQTGVFGTMAAIGTVPTTVTADVGPICWIN
jgi:hypothetical protein